MVENSKTNVIIFSMLVGVFFGIFANVPYLGMIALCGVFLACSPIVMLYLIMDGKMDLTSIKDSIIDGGICGFCANLTFSVGYCVVNALLFLLFKYTSNSILTSMIINAPVWLIILCVLFIGVLTAVTNSFTGLGMYYAIDFIRDSYEKRHKEKEKWLNLNQK